jgi:DNA-binding Lrp family transcriptional regulator
MDDLDLRLIELLENNARLSNVELGKKLGVSEGTIRNRIKYLVEQGIIQGFGIKISTRYGFGALVLVSLKGGKRTDVFLKDLKEIKEIKNIKEVTGPWDVVLEISAKNAEEYNDIIEKIREKENVDKTESLIVLKNK